MFEDLKHKQRFLLEMIESIEEIGTIEPELDTFFETYNGSYVYICDKKPKASISDIVPEEIRKFLISAIESREGHTDDKTDQYKAVVIKGGHGLRPHGEKPGENYFLKHDGSYVVDDEEMLLNSPLVVGMGLKRRVGHIRNIDTISQD